MTEWAQAVRVDSFELDASTITPPGGESLPVLCMKFWLNGSDESIEVALIGTHKVFRTLTSGMHVSVERAETQARLENRE